MSMTAQAQLPLPVFSVSDSVSVDGGSGPIRIRDSNEVTIIDDGSGGISVRDVAGNVKIGDAGSGSVDVSGVAGTYINHDD
jgi:hypothetical protein